MAKKSAVERNNKRKKLAKKYEAKRSKLKDIVSNKELPIEVRFEASLKLAKLPRNSSPTRVRERCEITGRPRGNYSKFKLSRIMLRKLAHEGLISGLLKASW